MEVEMKTEEKIKCDFCKMRNAEYDAKSVSGPWGYMCNSCFYMIGTGLGLGKGQKLKDTK
jgi:hypothetical protein